MMNLVLKLLFMLVFLGGCSSHVVIEPGAKNKILYSQAKEIRSKIITSSSYSHISDLENRNFYFNLCDGWKKIEADGDKFYCDYSVFLGLTKKYGCSPNVYVKLNGDAIELIDGLTICQ